MTEKQTLEQHLIEKASAGDRSAFADLVSIHYAAIYRTAFKWCGDENDAEDIAQDVCIKLGRAIRNFNGTAAFSTWLYRITLNTVKDMKRSQTSRQNTINAMAIVSEDTHHPNQEAELTQSQLWNNVQKLPEKQRDAVLLVHAEGLNHSEAADIMECSESTISWHIHEARKKLKSLMGANE